MREPSTMDSLRPSPHRSPSRRFPSRRWLARRRGAAAVEAAIAMPVLLVFVFGALELADGIFMKQALAVAAYEGARAVSEKEGTNADASLIVDEVLSARGIDDYELTITPEATAETLRSTPMTVRLAAPSDSISWSPLGLFSDKTLEKTVVMVRQ